MRSPLRALSRLALSLGALGLPWTIACAYGTEFVYRLGKVLDRDTHQPIAGVEVACVQGDRTVSAYTDASGDVSVPVDGGCDRLEARDVDGDANGLYATTSIGFPASDSFTILMTKK